jgi:FkbM family methyltransferase
MRRYIEEFNISMEEAKIIQTEVCMETIKFLQKEKLITKENYFKLARSCPSYGLIGVECYRGVSFTMINNNDDSVVSSIVWLDGFEETSLAIWSVLSENAQVILDIGAYSGIYSLVAAANHSAAEITAFEPLADNYARLTANIKLNPFIIRTLNIAVSDSIGTTNIKVFSGPGFLTSGGSIVAGGKQVQRSEQVEMRTIDALIFGRVVGIPELIKIDVEGAELSVLMGMRELFNQGYRPEFLIEVLDDKSGSELTSFFAGMDYSFYQVLESDKKLVKNNSLRGTGDLNALNNLITTKTANELTDLLNPLNISIECTKCQTIG